MDNEERLTRALAAPAAPARDLYFIVQVMRRAEAERFRADATRRLLRAAAIGALAGAALLPMAGWATQNLDLALDAALAAMGLLGLAGLARGARARLGVWAR